MSDDPLRIDLALARAAGLPFRSSNDGSAPAPLATTPAAPDAMFSPLALLIARFLPIHGAPAPVPTSAEARLLQGYLQQRVVAALRGAGAAVAPTTRIAVDAAGVLHVLPAPLPEERLAPVLQRDPDIARLVAILQRAASEAAPAGVPGDGMARVIASPRTARDTPDLRRAWPWRIGSDGTSAAGSGTGRALPYAWLVACACVALCLAWWCLG